MEALLAGLLEIAFELVLQVVFELVGGAIGHKVKEKRVAGGKAASEAHPAISVGRYACYGAICGVISLFVVPKMFMGTDLLRILNLVLTPIAAGAIMAAIGAWRKRREKVVIPLDTFFCGYAFALAMALVRFFFAD